MAKSYKLPWVPERETFALGDESLPQLLERLTKQFLARG
jgi:hypothetical protein